MAWQRRAGRGVDPDTGSIVSWSLAEGHRGRRWRSIRTIGGQLASVMLLETAGDRRFDRLELASPLGMLTLHPDADGRALHGNVVAPDGVRHLAFDWSDRHLLLVAEPVAVAALSAPLAGGVPGAFERRPAVSVDWRLEPAEIAVLVRREPDEVSYADVRSPDVRHRLDAAPDGPRLVDASEWPLELD